MAEHPPRGDDSLIDHLSRPGAYSLLSGAFAALFGAFLLAARRKGRALPERVDPGDVVLLGVATHKLSEIVTRDRVTSYLRAPFTVNDGLTPAGETRPRPRGEGLRRAVGELVTCPFCTGVWVASGLTYGLVLAPRPTRLLAGVFASVTVADFLHRAYQGMKHLAGATASPAPALETHVVQVGSTA